MPKMKEAKPGPHWNPWPKKKSSAKKLGDSLEQMAKLASKYPENSDWSKKTIDVVANIGWAIKKGDKSKVKKLLPLLSKSNVSSGLYNEISNWLEFDMVESSDRWKDLDVRELIEQLKAARTEATTSANAGAYQVPLGGSGAMQRRVVGAQDGYDEPEEYPDDYEGKKKRKKKVVESKDDYEAKKKEFKKKGLHPVHATKALTMAKKGNEEHAFLDSVAKVKKVMGKGWNVYAI